MADSDFVDMPEGLLDEAYLASRAELIDPAKAMGTASPGEPPWDDARLYAPDADRPNHGTSHVVIVDRYGDMASITTTGCPCSTRAPTSTSTAITFPGMGAMIFPVPTPAPPVSRAASPDANV